MSRSISSVPATLTGGLRRLARKRCGWLFFLAPSFAILSVCMVYPLWYSLRASLHAIDITRPESNELVGLSNYLEGLRDEQVLHSLLTTLWYTCCCVTIELVAGLFLALAVRNLSRRAKFILTPLLIVPMIVTPIVGSMMWRMMFNYTNGIINYLLSLVAMGPFNWLGGLSLPLYSLVLVEVWQNTPFVFLVMSAGLASQPREPVEAARIDGASPLQILWHVTIPYLKPLITLVLVFRTMLTFRVFDHVYVLTQGGPGIRTEVMSYLIYKNAFQFWRLGYSSALSYIMVCVVTLICVVYMRAQQARWNAGRRVRNAPDPERDSGKGP